MLHLKSFYDRAATITPKKSSPPFILINSWVVDRCPGGKQYVSNNSDVLVNYSYLADGSKAEALKADGSGLVYRGSLIYSKAADGTLTLESAHIPEGRLLTNGVRYHVTDHLGSVVAVVDGISGAVYQASEYAPYGSRTDNTALPTSSAPTSETFREQFTGKESQAPDFTAPYLDFGARHYNPSLSRWLVPDPLSEKYYDISPYAYCGVGGLGWKRFPDYL